MKRLFKRRPHAVFLVLCLAFDAAAQVPATDAVPGVSAGEHFAAGSRAFEAQDYARALAEFQAAIGAGSDGPAVHYNVAVCYYRLGEYVRAEEAFRSLARRFPEMRYLADYNLGLALTRLDRTAEARAAFERARGSDDERIAALAGAMLARLADAAPGPASDAPPATWTRLVDFRLGHDDNVALIDAASLPAGRSTDSAFSELLGYVGGPVSATGRWRFDATAYVVRYPDAGEFDQDGVYLGARYDRRVGNWRFSAGPQLGRSNLDGDGFEQHFGAVLDVRYAIAPGRSVVGVVLTHDDVDEVEAQFGYVEGRREQLRVLLDQTLASGRLALDYRLERNDRAGAGVSADRDRYSVRYRRLLNPAWVGELVYEYRVSEYARLEPPREEKRHQAGFDATRRLASDWRLNAQYRYADNESSDPAYSYERHRFALGLSKLF